MTTVKRFLRCEAGATAIEYGMIAAGIALAVVVIVYEIGGDLNTKVFTPIANALAG